MNIWLGVVLILVAFAVGYSLGKNEGIRMTYISFTGKSKPDED